MSWIRINNISIENYRSFGEKQTFEFPDGTYKKPVAILGYNNAGKTNLMNCLLYGVGNKFISEKSFEIKDLHNLTYDKNIKIEIVVDASDYDSEYIDKNTGEIKSKKETIKGSYTVSTNMENKELKSALKPSMFGKNKFYNIFYINFHNIKEEIATKRTSWGNLTSFLAKHIQKLVDTDSVMKEKKPDYEENVQEETETVLNDSKLSKFVEKIKSNYSNNLRNNACEVKFGLPSYEDIFLQMVFKIGLNGERENLVPIDHFGDGYISMFVMAVIQAIAESDEDDKCLFLFEEPESFLHENHQEYFYKMVLCGLAEKGHQVIYTTHSDKMVDAFDTRGIIRLEFDEEKKQTVKKYNVAKSDFKPLEPTDAIISFANYNSFIKSVEPNFNKLLFSRKVVLVEGPNDLLVYNHFIKNEIFQRTSDVKKAETHLNFYNIAILVHHGKATAYLLIELCKHLGVDYFVINDWDFPNDYVETLAKFETEENLKADKLYVNEDSTKKGMITTNWKLIDRATLSKIHFNVPKLEGAIGREIDDKDSFKIYEYLKGLSSEKTTEISKKLMSEKLRTFLEFNKYPERTETDSL